MAAVPRSSSLQEEVVAVEAQPHSSSHRVGVVVGVECSTFELQVVAVVAVVAAVGVHYSSLFLLAEEVQGVQGVQGVQPLSQIDEVAMEFL